MQRRDFLKFLSLVSLYSPTALTKNFNKKIDGYPTIMKYRYGKPVEEFVSKKNYKNLKKFIEK